MRRCVVSEQRWYEVGRVGAAACRLSLVCLQRNDSASGGYRMAWCEPSSVTLQPSLGTSTAADEGDGPDAWMVHSVEGDFYSAELPEVSPNA